MQKPEAERLRFFSVEAIAEANGIPKTALEQAIDSGELKVALTGRTKLLDIADVNSWLDAKKEERKRDPKNKGDRDQ